MCILRSRVPAAVGLSCVLGLGCGFSFGSTDLGENDLAATPKQTRSEPVGRDTEHEPDPEPPPRLEEGGVLAPPPDAGARTGPFRAFVTSKQVQGDLGGTAGADKLCNDVAKEAGLTGTFRAWISTETEDAVDRMTASGPWVGAGGETIAASRADLASGTLRGALDTDEKGTSPPVEDNRAWTGTGPDGKYKGADCAGWTSTAGEGVTGEADYVDARWTETSGLDTCDQLKRLYCFEQ